jgi:hypothetical protein
LETVLDAIDVIIRHPEVPLAFLDGVLDTETDNTRLGLWGELYYMVESRDLTLVKSWAKSKFALADFDLNGEKIDIKTSLASKNIIACSVQQIREVDRLIVQHAYKDELGFSSSCLFQKLANMALSSKLRLNWYLRRKVFGRWIPSNATNY